MPENYLLPKRMSASETSPGSPELRPRILVVDDETIICQLHSQILLRFGYAVDTANDGAVAWQLLQTEPYDLLVTDNAMPNLSGVELIQKLFADQRALPVIMVTARSPQAEFDQCPWLQPAAILLKPYAFARLVATVKAVLLASARTHQPGGQGSRPGGDPPAHRGLVAQSG